MEKILFSPSERIKALEQSKFRTKFNLDQNDQAYVARIGLSQIKAHAYDFIQKHLAPAEPKNDGKQTPFKGHPVFKAQHATATCCRGCLDQWYHIGKGRQLTTSEVDMIVGTLIAWIENKLHDRINEYPKKSG